MGLGAGTGTLSEDDVEFGGDPLEELRRTVNAESTPKGKEGGTQLENLEALLGITPLVGNALSLKDAFVSGGDAARAFGEGNPKSGAINSGLAGLNLAGAVLGLPFGKLAKDAAKSGKDSVNVFVPAGDDAAASRAKDMRAEGKSNSEVWKDTKKVFGSEGKLRDEIYDTRMEVDTSKLSTDGTVPLGDIMKHPELTEREPWLKSLKVRAAGNTHTGEPLRTARNNPLGELVLPPEGPKVKSNLAKLLQYNIADKYRFAPSLRHDVTGMRDALTESSNKLASGRYAMPEELTALKAYTDRVAEMRKLLDASSGSKFGSNLVTARSAGNVDAKKVQGRANATPEQLEFGYPYARQSAWDTKGGIERPAAFENLLPLLRSDATPDEVRQVVMDWHQFGSGRDASTEDLDALIAKLGARK